MSINNPNATIHESVVKDIVDVVCSLKDFDEVEFLKNINKGRSFKSITSATKDMILTFPVLCGSDISIETASMISKALEKKYAAMLQILFSAVDIKSNQSLIQYLQRFHANLGPMDGYLDQYIASVDKMVTTWDEGWEEVNVPAPVQEELREFMKNNTNYRLPGSINETSLSNYKVERKAGGNFEAYIIQEDGDTTFQKGAFGKGSQTQMYTAANGGTQNNSSTNTGDVVGSGGTKTVNYNYNDRATSLSGGMSNADAKAYADTATAMEKEYKMHTTTMLPMEIKKANELMPTLMVVRFNQYTESSSGCEVLALKTAVIGVKCKIYPIEFNDMAYRIQNKTKEKNFTHNLIRATTNEISFVKDFLFAIDKAKFDAKSYGKKGSSNKMWKVLERRAIKSKVRRSMKMDNDATAISTLVMSQNFVDYMKKVDSTINLDKSNTCRLLMESYNLMGMVIADESMEVCKFIFDTGEDDFENLSFNSLEREASDGSYRKVVNLLSKKM